MSGFSFYHFPVLESTNTTAKEYPVFSVITADMQTFGRGRRGRVWHSPVGNLYASVVFPAPEPDDFGVLSLTAAIALSESLPITNNIKWPNDILIGGKKVCGILIESGQNGLIIIGIGVNITSYPTANLAYPATSLKAEGCAIEQMALLGHFWDNLQRNLSLPADQIVTIFKQKATGIGDTIKVTLANHTLFGVFKDIDAKGNLILSPTNPTEPDKIIPYGEIFFN